MTKITSMVDVHALHSDYCDSSSQSIYEHDFVDRIMLQTTGTENLLSF